MIIVIPARSTSTRLPNKLLLPFRGKPLIYSTIDNALKTKATDIYVATESISIYDSVMQIDNDPRLHVVMTDSTNCGTDKVAIIANNYGYNNVLTTIVNLQADEPVIKPEIIDEIGESLDKTDYLISTLATPSTNHNSVHVVLNKNDEAMYFSRSNIPNGCKNYMNHIGIYAFRGSFFRHYNTLSDYRMCGSENLEQLKWLENGYKVKVLVRSVSNISVDTIDDYNRLKLME